MALSWVFIHQNQDGRRPRRCAASTPSAHLRSIFLHFSLLGLSIFLKEKLGFVLKGESWTGGQHSPGEGTPAPGLHPWTTLPLWALVSALVQWGFSSLLLRAGRVSRWLLWSAQHGNWFADRELEVLTLHRKTDLVCRTELCWYQNIWLQVLNY